MAVNKYDRPIDSQFINTYVPIPFEQMVQAGALKQQRYDQTAAAIDASIAQAESINAAPGTQDAIERDLAVNKIHGIRDKYYSKDLSDPMVVRQLNNEIRSAVKPADIKKWETTFQSWQTQQKHKQQQIARGEYNPLIDEDPISGWDSSTMGTYNYLSPTYQGKEATLSQYFQGLSRHGRVLGTTPEGYTKIGRTQEDINSILNQANQYATTPGGQNEIKIFKKTNPELAAQLDTNDNIARYIMNDYGQQFLYEELAGSRYPQGNAGTSPAFTKFFSEVQGKSQVSNVTSRDVDKKIRERQQQASQLRFTLDRLKETGGDPEEIKALEKQVQEATEAYTELEARKKMAIASVEDANAKSREDLRSKFLITLTNAAYNLSEDDAKKYLNAAESYMLDRESTNDQPGFEISSSISHSPYASSKPKTEEVLISRLNQIFDGSINKKTGKQLVRYAEQLAQYQTPQSISEINQNIRDEFSETMTGKELVPREYIASNGKSTFYGIDGKEHPSMIYPAVTEKIQQNPSAWELHVDNNDLENNNSKLRELITKSYTDKDHSFSLYTVNEVPNSKGNYVLNYTLTGPDIPDGKVNVGVELDPEKDGTAINNVFNQFVLSGTPIETIETMYRASGYTKMAEAEGQGKYPGIADAQGNEADTEVKFENGRYYIYLDGHKINKPIRNRTELGYELARLAVEAKNPDNQQ